ncbi:MAG: phage tail protein [Spirochaetales bacterium]|nr:phage tail protein [Spirochaetales bacterium]
MAEKRVESFLPSFFTIEIEGIECGKFFKCEGLEAETYIYEVEEGGLNTNTHKFFGRTRYANILLENGMTDNNDLWNWYSDTVLKEDKIERKNGSIIMYDSANNELKRWNFYRALPCRWIGPKLGMKMDGCAVEKLEIAHEGIEVQNA